MTSTTPTPGEHLTHPDGCPADRIETTVHPPDPTNDTYPDGVTTEHCLDCAAHWPQLPKGTVTGAFGTPAAHRDVVGQIPGGDPA